MDPGLTGVEGRGVTSDAACKKVRASSADPRYKCANYFSDRLDKVPSEAQADTDRERTVVGCRNDWPESSPTELHLVLAVGRSPRRGRGWGGGGWHNSSGERVGG